MNLNCWERHDSIAAIKFRTEKYLKTLSQFLKPHFNQFEKICFRNRILFYKADKSRKSDVVVLYVTV